MSYSEPRHESTELSLWEKNKFKEIDDAVGLEYDLLYFAVTNHHERRKAQAAKRTLLKERLEGKDGKKFFFTVVPAILLGAFGYGLYENYHQTSSDSAASMQAAVKERMITVSLEDGFEPSNIRFTSEPHDRLKFEQQVDVGCQVSVQAEAVVVMSDPDKENPVVANSYRTVTTDTPLPAFSVAYRDAAELIDAAATTICGD